ncbi:SLAM family member 5-like [Myxocyprinus asiaticus]|uniref:SLAM family member 5-like n=1 Tax=Myxocyprinus asiaticus TaxID=70543 RepID=UPI0022234B20|nr:SLAM family member 5-like [Myxocyprinus asiaticus]
MAPSVVLFCLGLCLPVGVFGEMKSVSVMEGDSVTLHTYMTEISDDELILWTFATENTSLVEINILANSITVYDGVDERFRNRLKVNNQTADLTITNTTITHSGLYQLKTISNSSKSFSLTVYARLPIPVITSNSSQCSSSSENSSNCVLVCSVVNVTQVTLSWYKGNSLFSSISVSDLNSSLSLPLEVEYQENNTYSCVINNPIRNQTKHLSITEVCQTCSETLVRIPLGAVQNAEEITYADPTLYKRNTPKMEVNEDDQVVYAGVAVR